MFNGLTGIFALGPLTGRIVYREATIRAARILTWP
jgi:hypothetical protein